MKKIPNHLESKNLVPFKRRRTGYHLFGLAREEGEGITDAVDPELRADEQSFVRHYLGYADTMLRHAEENPHEEGIAEEPASSVPANVTEMPKADDKVEEPGPIKNDGKNNAA
ncbi:MAG: hypothetical protein WA738_20280 [Candidatus Angelobacter sp.]